MAKKKPPKKYDWGPGGRVHSIPVSTHEGNVTRQRQARDAQSKYGIDLTAPVSAPLSSQQAYGMAESAAGRVYDPQIQTVESLQRSSPSWFANYVNQVGASQAAAQQYAQPLLDQAQAGITNAGQTAPGLDPSSPQFAKEQEAAKGRQALAQLGASTLAAIPTAANAYFGGLQTTAARELPQAQAVYGQQVAGLQGQRGQAVVDEYGRIRTGEQNAQIAYRTLKLNRGKAAADVDLERGVDPVTGKPLPEKPKTGYGAGAPGQNKYGYTYDEWTSLPESKKTKARAGKPKDTTAADKAAEKEAAKHKTAVKKASGGIETDVTNLITKWDSYKGQVTDDTSKPKDPVTGEYPARPVTPKDIKRILGQKTDAEMIHVMLLVRAGKPLDQASIDYLHRKDPNIRIPREWIRGKKPKSTAPPSDRPVGGTRSG